MKDNYINYNYVRRTTNYYNILKKKWYQLGIIEHIKSFIKNFCDNSSKYKQLKGKAKIIIIIENGPYYGNVAVLW